MNCTYKHDLAYLARSTNLTLRCKADRTLVINEAGLIVASTKGQLLIDVDLSSRKGHLNHRVTFLEIFFQIM